GATWRFSSAENRDLFVENPEKYAPQYGGYCAWAVAQGYTAATDPEAWAIVDDKLYLNYNKSVQAKWEKDVPGHIASADGNWPTVLE
ncbi:MAG: YHS domain-containing (seleno)protein, partial [Pseudomonadota bacterium]